MIYAVMEIMQNRVFIADDLKKADATRLWMEASENIENDNEALEAFAGHALFS
jgi:hypothetical protein